MLDNLYDNSFLNCRIRIVQTMPQKCNSLKIVIYAYN